MLILNLYLAMSTWQLVQHLDFLQTDLNGLDASLESISNSEKRFWKNPSILEAEAVRTMGKKVDECYQTIIDDAQVICKIIDAIEVEESARRRKSVVLPSIDEVPAQVGSFFRGNVKLQAGTLPINCGSHAYELKQPKGGDFVCAKLNESFILMIVLMLEREKCLVYDPTDIEDGVKVIELENSQWTPLPTVLPEVPIARWEHERGSSVLSLWRTDTQSEWTTEFYSATVVERPCDRVTTDEATRGYVLDFGDELTDIVPEQFVVECPVAWWSK